MVELLKSVKFDLQHSLAFAWSMFAMIYVSMITFGTVPQANQRYADTVLGFLLGTIVATIINYFFGSSKSSKEKDATISGMLTNEQADKPAETNP